MGSAVKQYLDDDGEPVGKGSGITPPPGYSLLSSKKSPAASNKTVKDLKLEAAKRTPVVPPHGYLLTKSPLLDQFYAKEKQRVADAPVSEGADAFNAPAARLAPLYKPTYNPANQAAGAQSTLASVPNAPKPKTIGEEVQAQRAGSHITYVAPNIGQPSAHPDASYVQAQPLISPEVTGTLKEVATHPLEVLTGASLPSQQQENMQRVQRVASETNDPFLKAAPAVEQRQHDPTLNISGTKTFQKVLDPKSKNVFSRVMTGGTKGVEALSSVDNLGLMAGMYFSPADAGQLISAVFSAQMAQGAGSQGIETLKAAYKGDYGEAAERGANALVSAAFAATAGKHALGIEKAPSFAENARQGLTEGAGDVMGGRTITDHPFTPVVVAPSRDRTNVLATNSMGSVRQAKGQAPSVWLNPAAWESLMKQIYPEESAASTNGFNVPKRVLESHAKDPQFANSHPEITELLTKANEGAGEGGAAIANKRGSIQDNVRVMREELNHTWQRSLAAGGDFENHLKPGIFSHLRRQIPQGMYDHLLYHGYDGYNSPQMVTEAAAKLMGGRASSFSVTPEEKEEFLDSYFSEVAAQHGADSLNSLTHLMDNAQSIKEKVYAEYAGKENTGTDAGLGNKGTDGGALQSMAGGGTGGTSETHSGTGSKNGGQVDGGTDDRMGNGSTNRGVFQSMAGGGQGGTAETVQGSQPSGQGAEGLFNREKVKDDADKFKSALTIPSQEGGVEVPSVNVDVLFPPPKEMESAWRDASMNPLLHEQFKRTGISGFSIEEPYKFDLSEQGNIDPKTGKIAINAAASNPTHTLAHEVAHDIYRRLTPENRAIIDRYVTGATYIHAEHTGGLEERIADHFADEIANPMSASAPPSIRKIFFESPLEPRPAVTTKAVELAPPEPKRPIYGTWSDVARNGGSLRTGDDIRGLVAKDGDFPLVLKDTYGARHVMPASVAADVLDSPAHNYVNEVFMAKDHIYDKSDFELKRDMEQANKMLAANSYMSSKPGHYNEPDPDLSPLSDSYRKELQDKVTTSEKILADRKAGVPHRPVPVVPIDTVRTQTSGARMLTDAINTFGNRNRLAREYKNPELPATTTPKTDDALFNREKEKPYKELDRLDPKAVMGTPRSAAIITGDGKVKVGDGHFELMEDNGYKNYADLFAAGGVRIRPAYGGMNIEIGKIDDDVLSRVRKTIASFPGMEFTVEFTPLNGRSSKTISGDADLVLLGLDKWQRVGEAAAKYASPSYWHERGNDELFNREQTKKPEFQNWFSGSKVVDKSGLPLVVYHGTYHDFDTFDTNEGAMERASFFTSNPEVASGFADPGRFGLGTEEAPNPNVKAVYLKAINPLTIPAKKIMYSDGSGHSFTKMSKYVEKAKAEGYDGLHITSVPEKGGVADQWAVFAPEQIKSAIGNSGAFDPHDPNILRNREKPKEDTPVPTETGYRSMVDTGTVGIVDLTHEDYKILNKITGDKVSSNGKSISSKRAQTIVGNLISEARKTSDASEKDRLLAIADHIQKAANDNGEAGVPILTVDPNRSPEEQRELEKHEAMVHAGQRAIGEGDPYALFPKSLTDDLAQKMIARKAWYSLRHYGNDRAELAAESEAFGLSGKFNRLGLFTEDEIDELMWEHLQAHTAHHGEKLNTLDLTGKRYVDALREAAKRHDDAKRGEELPQFEFPKLGKGGGQEKEVPSPSGTPEGGGTEGDQGDSGAGSEGVGAGGEGESDSESLEDRIAPSAAGQESSPEQPKVAVQPVTVQGGTTILSMPVHEPTAKVHTSVPSLTTTQVSVPLKTALDVTPVVTRRVLSRKEIMAMAAGLNPQRQVKNVRELMAEAKLRSPNRIIP